MSSLVNIATRSLLWAMVLGPVALAHAAETPASGAAASMSAEQKVDFVKAAATEIASATQEMESTLEKARGKGDSSAVKWLVPRVTAAQALNRVVGQSVATMQAALEAGNQEAKIDLEFRKVSVAIEKARLLLGETQRFKQGQAVASGATSLEVQEQYVLNEPFDEVTIDDIDVPLDAPQTSPFL